MTLFVVLLTTHLKGTESIKDQSDSCVRVFTVTYVIQASDMCMSFFLYSLINNISNVSCQVSECELLTINQSAEQRVH